MGSKKDVKKSPSTNGDDASPGSGGKNGSKKNGQLPSGLEKLPKKAYENELERMQAELVEMQAWLKESGNRLVVVFEGRDAAGKGSAIKRITQYLNPRHARVVALPAPTAVHKTQWYFQRYIEHLPAAGEIVIFDRSWYNRAGVERVMGFCTTDEYRRFLHQAPIFERLLVEDGIMLRKYWFSVSDEEQERRFRDRHSDPMRRWKLSPMDLESINRWEAYSRAKDEMFVHTDIPEAPWYTVESEDKKRSRINVISHLLSTVPWEKLDPPSFEIPERPASANYERPPREEFRYVPDVASNLLDG
ncbi:polyphosphate kinase 2 [Dietzia sp. UBA5065]|jgi:polyphosphate kinase 2|uniref:polyphosphate kinase 2 n=1 Tax=Dietzia sp. UBA5065 TaxID=1946422 RepID=UPI0025C1D554|nr:polyphosphate kinase 2 [Dietzia sp. UBA5065]